MLADMQVVIDEVGCAGIEPLLIPPEWAAAAEVCTSCTHRLLAIHIRTCSCA
jgi:hypothetical protein